MSTRQKPPDNSISNQWLIKSEDQLKGPYSTDAVSKMILEGIFSGQEEISTYPDGEWKSLSKQIEFYEVLLESLENPVERDEKRAAKMEAETVVRSLPKISSDEASSSLPSLSDEIKALVESEKLKSDIPVLPPALAPEILTDGASPASGLPVLKEKKKFGESLLNARDKLLTLELEQIKNIQKRELAKFLPFVLIVVCVLGLVGYLIFSDDEVSNSGWVLQVPRKNQSANTEQETKQYKKKAITLIKTGILEDAVQAQKQLVAAVEGSPRDLESLGLLCSTYHILWPYTKQTSEDLRAFSYVTQLARTANPISAYSDSCQSTYLIAKGQFRDAHGLIEKTLDQTLEDRFILYPFLYVMKGEILEDQQNFIHAQAFYDEAMKSFPGWAWAEFAAARTLYKQNKFNESRLLYEKILKSYPDFRAALYGVALNELQGQASKDKAYDYFSKAYEKKGKLPKAFHLEALQEYIKVLLEKNMTSKALAVAQYGLQISPSHRALKEIVVSLGGDERVTGSNSVNDLIMTGDQFARSGDHLAAQAQFKAAFDLDSKNPSLAIKTAKSLWALSQTREAIAWLDKAIKLDKRNMQAYALKADYLSQRFNFSEATKVLFDANAISPNNYDIIKIQALIEFRKNNMPGAISYGERALKLYNADVELLAKLAQAHIYLFLNAPARTTQEQDKKKESLVLAQKYSGKAVDLEPGWPEAQITYAKYLYAAQGNLQSEAYLNKLIKNFSYTLEYRLGLAEFYEFQEKYLSASQIYQQLVEADPKNKKANAGLARSYKGMNKLDLAQKYYLAAAVLDPSDVEPLFETAQLQLEDASAKGNNVEIQLALNKFKTVRNINPNYPRISYSIAKALLELGQFQEAVEMIKEEKTKNPNLADPYLLAAEVYDRKGQYKECAAEYAYAIKLRSNSADLYVKAASCYRKSDALDIAQDMLEIARQKESGYPGIYKERGYLFEKQGLPRQAKEAYQTYLELSPNALDRAEVESRLSSL